MNFPAHVTYNTLRNLPIPAHWLSVDEYQFNWSVPQTNNAANFVKDKSKDLVEHLDINHMFPFIFNIQIVIHFVVISQNVSN